jgi:hypothetical protein
MIHELRFHYVTLYPVAKVSFLFPSGLLPIEPRMQVRVFKYSWPSHGGGHCNPTWWPCYVTCLTKFTLPRGSLMLIKVRMSSYVNELNELMKVNLNKSESRRDLHVTSESGYKWITMCSAKLWIKIYKQLVLWVAVLCRGNLIVKFNLNTKALLTSPTEAYQLINSSHCGK